MKYKLALFSIFTISIFALGVLITTLFNTAPVATENVIMFYISLFLTFFGIIFFLLHLLARRKYGETMSMTILFSLVKTTIIIDLLLIILLFLQSKSVLNLPTAAVLAVAALIIIAINRKRWTK